MTTSIFNVIDWQEKFVFEKKLAHATAKYKLTGDLVGEITVDYSIFYLDYNHEDVHQSSSRFEGFGVFKGEYSGKSGSFALYDRGSFIKNEYQAKMTIIEETGTADFENISGHGSYTPTTEGMSLSLNLNFKEF